MSMISCPVIAFALAAGRSSIVSEIALPEEGFWPTLTKAVNSNISIQRVLFIHSPATQHNDLTSTSSTDPVWSRPHFAGPTGRALATHLVRFLSFSRWHERDRG